MRKVKFLSVLVLLALVLSAVVGEALAAGTWYWYDVTVPKFGGSVPTYNETKQCDGQCSVHSNLVGGDYDLKVRLELVDNSSVSGWYIINDGTHIRFDNDASASDVVHMRFKTAWYDPVDVQANGHYMPVPSRPTPTYAGQPPVGHSGVGVDFEINPNGQSGNRHIYGLAIA